MSTLIGEHPQRIGYYWTLVSGTFRTMFDLGMLVLGSGLLGLAITLILRGLGLVDVEVGVGIAGAMGAALIIGVCGLVAFGLASEGRYGAVESVAAFPSLEVAVGRAAAAVLLTTGLSIGADRLDPLVSDLAFPYLAAVEVLRAVGSAGLVMALVGVPLMWAVRRGLERIGWGRALELPAGYVVWSAATLAMFTMPT